MSRTEKIFNNLESSLKLKVEEYFDSIERFDGKFILNSRIRKDSIWELTPICSEFVIFNLKELQLTDIILGDLKDISLIGDIKIASSFMAPKHGKELNSWSETNFNIRINAELLFNQCDDTIEISKVEVWSR
jgi:hypothetical protein